jgi:peptide/nickel transport system ATP-binding protein
MAIIKQKYYVYQSVNCIRAMIGVTIIMNEKDIILDVEDLVVDYISEDGIVQAVKNINFKLRKNSSMGLVGETGAGKTTTALAIMNLIPHPPGVIRSGKIVLEQKNLLSMNEGELEKVRGKDVSMIFQDPMTSLNPVLTIGH